MDAYHALEKKGISGKKRCVPCESSIEAAVQRFVFVRGNGVKECLDVFLQGRGRIVKRLFNDVIVFSKGIPLGREVCSFPCECLGKIWILRAFPFNADMGEPEVFCGSD